MTVLNATQKAAVARASAIVVTGWDAADEVPGYLRLLDSLLSVIDALRGESLSTAPVALTHTSQCDHSGGWNERPAS